MRSVEHVLITHGHPDHLDPAFLLSREWVSTHGALHVWAPPRAIDLCRPWIGPESSVELHEIRPGDHVGLDTTTGRYDVHVLAAAHSSGNGDELSAEAVLFSVDAPDGHRLLYATDTAQLPAETQLAVTGRFDVILIDETFGDTNDHGTGHLDLETLPEVLNALRANGAIDDDTLVIATHLSHHNPPTPELRARLAAMGAHVVDDLTVVDTRQATRVGSSHVIIGGARSGKSRHAESLLALRSAVTYVATGDERPDDAEWQERIQAHRARRPSAWSTRETLDVADAICRAEPGSAVLVDCIALWLTGQLDRIEAWSRLDRGERAAVVDEIDALAAALIDAVRDSRADVVLVTNEVGMGIVPPTASGRLFQDLLGSLNARLVEASDHATFVVAGRALTIKAPDHHRIRPEVPHA
jgi:adenosylcobinamide kinase/adenosylcobinamide-phosphate guanylyltransferase